jgi:hypothetical protein
MRNILTNGFKISNADQKALDHYLLVTPKKWAQDALAGMINRAIKTIIKDYFEIYKSKQIGSVASDPATIIPIIIAMPEFKRYNNQTPTAFDKHDKGDLDYIQRDEPANKEIWQGGFNVEEHEHQALTAFYQDYEAYLTWTMNNKVYRRKNAFIKEHQQEMIRNGESIPAKHDAFINHVTSKANYKNRTQREADSPLGIR